MEQKIDILNKKYFSFVKEEYYAAMLRISIDDLIDGFEEDIKLYKKLIKTAISDENYELCSKLKEMIEKELTIFMLTLLAKKNFNLIEIKRYINQILDV